VAELKGVSEYEIQASSRCGGLGEEVRWNFLCVGDEGRGGGEWREGKIKAIGVSNFQIHHLEELAKFATVTPVLNQVESHPKLIQSELRDYAAKHDIKIQAWSPLMQGKILKDATLQAIADKYGKSVAQVILRWDIQRDVLLVVKSVHQARMQSNADVFDFALDQADMDKINAMNEDLRVGPNPDEFDF